MGFNESDGLFRVSGGIEGLTEMIDEISELIVMGIVTKGPPGRKIYIDYRIFLVHWSFPGVSHLHVGFWGRRMGFLDPLLESPSEPDSSGIMLSAGAAILPLGLWVSVGHCP